MKIEEFLRARFDEEEAIAQASVERGLLGFMEVRVEWADRVSDGQRTALAGPDTAFLAAQRPRRVLDEIASRRAIVDQAACLHCETEEALAWAMRVLSHPYRDHPDYDERWRP